MSIVFFLQIFSFVEIYYTIVKYSKKFFFVSARWTWFYFLACLCVLMTFYLVKSEEYSSGSSSSRGRLINRASNFIHIWNKYSKKKSRGVKKQKKSVLFWNFTPVKNSYLMRNRTKHKIRSLLLTTWNKNLLFYFGIFWVISLHIIFTSFTLLAFYFNLRSLIILAHIEEKNIDW
jgi:hypothetical protein